MNKKKNLKSPQTLETYFTEKINGLLFQMWFCDRSRCLLVVAVPFQCRLMALKRLAGESFSQMKLSFVK
jgi:hypothetical protein